MALPTYNKDGRKRKGGFQQLPKDAYVVKIKGARLQTKKDGVSRQLVIAFDIAEGEYKGFFNSQYEQSTSEDKKWPNDGVYYLTVPKDGDENYIFDNWNTFFADLEDSNSGFVFDGDEKKLKDKLIGGKFRLEQHEYKGNVYTNTRLYWTCVADDVRNGKAGRLPNDKLIDQSRMASRQAPAGTAGDDFMNIPEGSEPEIPF